jgi:hypothetical protein
MSLILIVTNKPFMLHVVMLNVTNKSFVLNVVVRSVIMLNVINAYFHK